MCVGLLALLLPPSPNVQAVPDVPMLVLLKEFAKGAQPVNVLAVKLDTGFGLTLMFFFTLSAQPEPVVATSVTVYMRIL